MNREAQMIDPAEWARVHDESAAEHFVFRRAVTLASEWAREVSCDGSWLDAGCGTGHLAAGLAQQRARVTGVDRSISMILYADGRWKRPAIRFSVCEVGALPFMTSSFDGVVAISLLGCVARPREFFDECARVLTPGGVLCMSATNRHSLPLAVIGLGRRLRPRSHVERYAAYDPRALATDLRGAGFDLERQRFYGRVGLPSRWTTGLEHEVAPGSRSFVASNLMILARRV